MTYSAPKVPRRAVRFFLGFLGAATLTLMATSCSNAAQSTRPIASTAPQGSASTSSVATSPPTTARPVRQSTPHVMVVMMENKNYADVIGQGAQPFTNYLAHTYGVATQSYAFGHPSLPNYLDLISGSNQGVTDDGDPSSHSFPGVPTIADQLASAGVGEKAYAENLPPDPTISAGEYAARHFPWVYFPATKMPITGAASLVTDLNSPDPPDFVWYTPNLIDDEHDGTVQEGDTFLAHFIPEVQSTAWYQAGGQIIIEWDESDGDDSGINGTDGGHIPTIVVSQALKLAPREDALPVDTAGILASIENVYGLAHLGAAADPANGNIGALLITATGS
jgi:hypothetical protein